MRRQKIYQPRSKDHVQFQSLWSELYCRQALQQGNVRAQLCLGSVFFCACWTFGWKKAKPLRLEFWCSPSPHCCCFNSGLPCLASSVHLTMGGWSTLLLPCPLPSLMLYGMTSDAATSRWIWRQPAMCWLFSSQSLPGRQKQHLEQTLSFAVHKAAISWDGTREKNSNVCWKQKGLSPQTLASWVSTCWHEITAEFFSTQIWELLMPWLCIISVAKMNLWHCKETKTEKKAVEPSSVSSTFESRLQFL